MKSIGGIIFWLIGLATLMAIPMLYVAGIAIIVPHLLPIANTIAAVTFRICLLIFLPLALARKTRPAALIGFYLASFAFGATLWLTGFAIAYSFWGAAGIIIGMLLGGVGVVPVALIASVLHTQWSLVGELLLGLILTFGIRLFAVFLGKTLEKSDSSADMSSEQASLTGQSAI